MKGFLNMRPRFTTRADIALAVGGVLFAVFHAVDVVQTYKTEHETEEEN